MIRTPWSKAAPQRILSALSAPARSISRTAQPPSDINKDGKVAESNKTYSTAVAEVQVDQYNYDTMARALSHPETPVAYVRDVVPCEKQVEVPMDGNQAASYVAYGMSETSFIYPISPATSMGEHMDNWSSQGKKNVWGQSVRVITMQSEAGAVAACHGSVAAGVLTTTFTASQGLLLMIPNLYLIAGELMPYVLHVSARTISKHALSIFNDHSDVMACRQTGFAMLCSFNVQEVMDLGLVSHVASMRSRVPFLHFFDGFRTSHEIAKIKTIPYDAMKQLVPTKELKNNLRDLALNPQHPIIRGTGQRPDIFFQATVAAGRFYDAAPDVVQAAMDEVAKLTGRSYKLFEYMGSPTAERVVVLMGSAAETAEDVIDFLNKKGENVGLIKVRLYRPWSAKHFLSVMPDTVKSIAVLDRTREDGAQGNPLYLDVASTIMDTGVSKLVTGGTYGLASKEFVPGQLIAVFDNLNLGPKAKKRFVVGVEDDVTHTSLPFDPDLDTVPEGTRQCMFWGLGGDGTIGANKAAIKNLAIDGKLNAQGYFSYDSHKEMGATISHLRFGEVPIKAHYMINSGCDYIACHHPSYVRKFDLLQAIKEDGIFVLNCPWTTIEQIEQNLSTKIKKDIASRRIKFFTIDATALALELGLGMRINTLMQSCFYRLSGVLPVEKALDLLRASIVELYTKKGPEVVKANQRAVDAAEAGLRHVEVPAHWADLTVGSVVEKRDLFTHVNVPAGVNKVVDEFVHTIMDPVLSLEGDKLPVSTFIPGGVMPTATCMHEKRGLAPQVPVWSPDKCTQCNYCAIVCPHAVIRPFLCEKNELAAAPEGFQTRKATGGAEYAGMNFSIQISTNDCTGCAICVQSCPDDALHMEPYEQVKAKYLTHWDYAISLPQRNPADKNTVKGSQFQLPMLEFSGACPGCGETPYVKLVTQLFGDRMVIANASGCSSVWGGTATTNPYTVNEKGYGPAWGRSLFEDNAEYGFGMAMGTKQRRHKLKLDVELALEKEEMPKALRSAFEGWLGAFENYDKANKYVSHLEQLIPHHASTPLLQDILENMDLFRPQSHWIIGGDGWAYDIGYGGLDHVLSRGENVNIMVLDTEMYSNTGGQSSKSTQKSTVLKFAQSGKKEMKKDLGTMAMTYGNVYVASVALGANYNQCVQAIREAESYEGPSLILCYAPCIDWGIDMQYQMESQRIAVDSGYWKLYRYDPRLALQGKPPMQLDAAKIKSDVKKYLETQNRFKQLLRKDKEKAKTYFSELAESLTQQHEEMKRKSMDNYELLDHLKGLLGETSTGDKCLILYASETGTAAEVSKMFQAELKRRNVRAKCMAMDDYDFENLPNETKVFMIGATCGQGEYPDNSKAFRKALMNPALPADWLKDTKFAVFSLGDTAYVYYNKVGKDFDQRMAELGAQRLVPVGLANEKDDEKWETAWTEWVPDLYGELQLETPKEELPPPSFIVKVQDNAETSLAPETDIIVPPGAKLVPMNVSKLLSPEDYERDIRHFEFDLSKTTVSYNLGDSLGIWAWNSKDNVNAFLEFYGMKATDVISIQDTTDSGKLPEVVTGEQAFAQILDLFGRPSRRFYGLLAMLAKDPAHAAEIQHLMSKEGKEDFKAFLKETPSYFDLMKKWDSAKVPLDLLLEYVPNIKPRLYSIASAPETDGDTLQLCIVADDWYTPSGKYCHGLTTRYLRDLRPTEGAPVPVAARVNTASFTLPANPQVPMILVALGTGIAPCRALIRDRLTAGEKGAEMGPMGLFFGVRNRATEYSYGPEEWDPLHDGGKGPLTVLAPAFSRDQKEKIYVQHRLAEHSELIYDWIVKQNGYYLLCGPGGPPCAASKQAIIDAIAKHGAADGFTKEKAEQYVTDMQISGRFNEEVW